MTTLKLVASMNAEPGKSPSTNHDVSSSGGEPEPQPPLNLAQTSVKTWSRVSPFPPPTKPLPEIPSESSREPRRSSTQDPPAPSPQVQEKRGYTEPVGTNYASIMALDSAAVDEDPSDTDSAIIQSAKGRSPTGREIRLTRAFNRRRILDWDLDCRSGRMKFCPESRAVVISIILRSMSSPFYCAESPFVPRLLP
ncbi:hypothetical protein C8R42DRAFT_772378 [Lentinula raphanica]|nr:hypothetical protein C8R42DRAFT_772378 [Lentinula raphanica]